MANGEIHVRNLRKVFKKGNVEAVKDVTFDVKAGEFYAFLGPNGAGKSTTVQMLTTLLEPTGGEASVAGFDVLKEHQRIRENIGVALQETGIDPDLTGRELLQLQAKFFGFSARDAKKRAEELLEIVDLTGDADRKSGNYSGGMRRRLDLALTLVHQPPILFLDEPTTGLDPSNRKSIWEEMRRLNKETGTTIFLTTQYLEEADQLADRIGIIQSGEIVASGTAESLKSTIGKDLIEIDFEDGGTAEKGKACLQETLQGTDADLNRQEERLSVFVVKGNEKLSEIVTSLNKHHIDIKAVNLKQPTLDDVFLDVVSKKSSEGANG